MLTLNNLFVLPLRHFEHEITSDNAAADMRSDIPPQYTLYRQTQGRPIIVLSIKY